MNKTPIVVVGAGIIGVTLAYELVCRGCRVLLVERDSSRRGASYGNMASIAVTEFLPSARLSVLRKIPFWLLDPTGPVRVRPGYAFRVLPWFLRFLSAAKPSRMQQITAAGAALSSRALADTQDLLQRAGLGDQITDTGCLALYRDENEFRSDRDHIHMLEKYGFCYEPLDGEAAREMEPELSPMISKALLFPDNRSIRDPGHLLLALTDRFRAAGGEMMSGEAVSFSVRDGELDLVVLEDGQKVAAASVVVAAGAFSGRLARHLGERMPLETERGYHTQIMNPGVTVRHSLIWPARAFMVTPTAGGIRVGGTVEMAGLDAPPDYRRCTVTLSRAREALPNLRCEETSQWMGHRPAFPDTIPILSRSAKVRNVYYATGHGHLGLTYAATTGRLMAQLVTGGKPEIDLSPYSIDRF